MDVQPQAVIFDFGGTLMDDVFDTEAGNRRLHSLIQTGDVSIEEYRAMVAEIDRELGPRRTSSCLEHNSQCFGRLLNDCLGIQHGFGTDRQEREFWNASERWTLVPGAEDVIRRLRASGTRLGILSNMTFGGEYIREELQKVGIADYFDAVVTSADYGVRKPHVLAFRAIAGRMGVEPSQSWYVGDRLDTDVAGAKSAGMKTVWLNHDGETPQGITVPDEEIREWSSFADIWPDTGQSDAGSCPVDDNAVG